MNFAWLRPIGFAVLLVLLAGAGCNRPKRVSSESSTPPTRQEVRTSVTMQMPDAFYDPPPDVPRKPGALLRSEPLKDVTLPVGVRGWRILYATSVDDNTPATAVATVFAPTGSSATPRPVIAWEHATTGLLQKCMPSLLSAASKGIFERDRIVMSGWVVVATDYSFAEKGGPHPYLIGEAEARAALDSVRAARKISELMLDRRMVVWGYSQGGHAALWTGIVGPRYAPDLEIRGVAAIAPAANIEKILDMNVEMDKLFGPYLAESVQPLLPRHQIRAGGSPGSARRCASNSKLMRLPPARGSGTYRGTGGNVRRSSISDEFKQNASSSPSAEHGGSPDTGSRRYRARSFGHRCAAVCHRRVCRRALRCWSAT